MSTPCPTLPALLGRPLVAMAADLAGTGPPCPLPWWANLLRVLDGGEVAQRDLRARSRLSRRALAPMVEAGTRRDWLAVTGAPRAKVVALTPAGRAVAGAWRPRPAAVEDAWRADLGAARVDRLRASLVALVGRLPLALPHHPATYGSVDGTIRGAFGPDARGQDWSPVARAGAGEDVAALPLHALLAQAVVAFALDYEVAVPVAFLVAESVLRHVADGGTPWAALSGGGRLPHACRYALGRFLLGTIEQEPGRRTEVVHLTARGRAARDAHPAVVARITAAWRTDYGADVVAEVEDAATALVSDLPPDLADLPADM